MAIRPSDLPETVNLDSFESLNPVTGEVVATFDVCTEDEVRDRVREARAAASWWQELGFEGRRARLLAWKSIIANRSSELAELIRRENGKPINDALIEINIVLDHLDWAARNAKRVLGRRRVKSTLLLLNQAAYVEYPPAGVVGVIGPWNYPLHTPLGSVSYALAAGNTVVFKPSEHTPAVAKWAVDAFCEVVPERPVLQMVSGFGETGAALCRAGVDVLAFTGSAATGRKVMAECAKTLTKVVMECGGKDAMIVAEDADLDAAATAAVWGACSNAGQTCAGVERVYVVQPVYDTFVEKLVQRMNAIRAGDHDTAHFGAITMPGQVDVIRQHLEEALARGARALVGGPESVRAPFVDPVLLVDVPDDTLLMTEETFGPLLPVTPVRDVDEAVERANDTVYGLGATVYSRRGGLKIAERLNVGMVSINSMLSYAGVPALPFGGRGESGFGRIHGEDGLKEFTLAKAMTKQRVALPGPLNYASFTRAPWLMETATKMAKVLHGRH